MGCGGGWGGYGTAELVGLMAGHLTMTKNP